MLHVSTCVAHDFLLATECLFRNCIIDFSLSALQMQEFILDAFQMVFCLHYFKVQYYCWQYAIMYANRNTSGTFAIIILVCGFILSGSAPCIEISFKIYDCDGTKTLILSFHS